MRKSKQITDRQVSKQANGLELGGRRQVNILGEQIPEAIHEVFGQTAEASLSRRVERILVTDESTDVRAKLIGKTCIMDGQVVQVVDTFIIDKKPQGKVPAVIAIQTTLRRNHVAPEISDSHNVHDVPTLEFVSAVLSLAASEAQRLSDLAQQPVAQQPTAQLAS